jgi:probable rRNA maturation factor
VYVADEQEGSRALPVDVARWTALTAAVIDACLPGAAVEVSVSFVDEARMAALNQQYMGHDVPTDVLAFPIDDEPGVAASAEAPRLLGDLVICPAVASGNAADHAGTYEDEIALLLVHGVLHLLGMDHAADADRARMQARERELLVAHHGPPTNDPWA